MSERRDIDSAARGRCVGVLGLLFGHKFKYSDWRSAYQTDNCLRCGMPKGGWPK